MKKIYYAPGLISAILIPLLLWYYGNQRVHPQYTVVDLGIPSKIRPNRNFDNTFEPYRNWNYKKIVVKPNTAIQNQKIYISELKELQARNEKESGIEFIINDKNSYEDFIVIINVMNLSKQETFCADIGATGHIFAIHEYVDPNKHIHENICSVGPDIIYKEENQYTGFDQLKSFAKLPKQSFYMIFGFLVFINISMLSIKERFQLYRSN
ncbi:hypothetical protein H5J24_14625 [Chryseobacterium capnotolerans]|uniref:hypothetical protein n=1 Tax=Chryseobacterium TaxID=59732 RepID=UPI00083A0B91|nr:MULTISPECIES: hypothetical protein [Chryseobacterium]UHO37001.1 hypothetical protein H5J24_14625 [Chryseobacterium capnotolerans]